MPLPFYLYSSLPFLPSLLAQYQINTKRYSKAVCHRNRNKDPQPPHFGKIIRSGMEKYNSKFQRITRGLIEFSICIPIKTHTGFQHASCCLHVYRTKKPKKRNALFGFPSIFFCLLWLLIPTEFSADIIFHQFQ